MEPRGQHASGPSRRSPPEAPSPPTTYNAAQQVIYQYLAALSEVQKVVLR